MRVLIVEDHVMVAEGLHAALGAEDDFHIVGVVGSVAEATAAMARSAPDVVLMDYRLPDGDGAAAATGIRHLHPETQVVLLTAEGSEDVVARAADAGCAEFLHKSQPLAAVVAAIRTAAGRSPLTRSGPGPAPASDRPELSAREVEILQLLGRGQSTDAIAGDLFLSPHTVRNHIRNLTAKLGAHSRLEAVAVGRRIGLISPDRDR